jgi:hypothetical protein
MLMLMHHLIRCSINIFLNYIFDYIFIGEHEIKLTKFWDVQE